MLEYVIPSVKKGPLNKTWTNLGHRNIIKGVYQYANQSSFAEKNLVQRCVKLATPCMSTEKVPESRLYLDLVGQALMMRPHQQTE
jgi:hypothetical protein